jgi:hypothetical protein
MLDYLSKLFSDSFKSLKFAEKTSVSKLVRQGVLEKELLKDIK